MKVIPAIDLINGQCVRLSEGNYATKKVYFKNPLKAAQSFQDAGLQYLHLVDLDGAKLGKVKNWDVLELICRETDLKVDFSGGIKTRNDVDRIFNLGASQITVGSLAVKSPEIVEEWIVKFGADKIIIGADVKEDRITINGWQQTTAYTIFDYIEKFMQQGAINFLCTDVSKDGKLQGPSFQLYQQIIDRFSTIQLIASGGVSEMEDINKLNAMKCFAVIVGKAIYENRILMSDLVNLS